MQESALWLVNFASLSAFPGKFPGMLSPGHHNELGTVLFDYILTSKTKGHKERKAF